MAEAAAPDLSTAPERARQSYRQILKASALIGGSAAFETAIGLVRTKAMAVLLGPAGFGLMGAYGMVSELGRTLAQMGVNASGVRQIAEASASGDAARVARTAAVLRRTSLACALLGALTLAALAGPVATLTFGDDANAHGVLLLSVAVFLSLLAAGQAALLQGLRRIGDLARVSVIGSLLGTCAGVPIVWVWGEAGIVPTLIVVAAGSLAASWWYGRRLQTGVPPVGARAMLHETGELLRLGLAFLGSALLMAGALYAVRVVVLRHEGLEAAGIYQAASAVAALSTAFVVQALGADFYPRLTGVANDDAACNRLVNEQTRVSMLLAAPGLVATLTFAPFVIELLYSAHFAAATDVIRWICLGLALRVLAWPAGTIVIAKARKTLFVGIELVWAVANVGAAVWCVARYGVVGAGIAFFAAYVLHALIVFAVVHSLTGFRGNRGSLGTSAGCLALIGGTFVAFAVLTPGHALAVGIACTLLCAGLCGRTLLALTAPDSISPALRRLLRLQPRAA